jgi:hypothetical protein
MAERGEDKRTRKSRGERREEEDKGAKIVCLFIKDLFP